MTSEIRKRIEELTNQLNRRSGNKAERCDIANGWMIGIILTDGEISRVDWGAAELFTDGNEYSAILLADCFIPQDCGLQWDADCLEEALLEAAEDEIAAPPQED